MKKYILAFTVLASIFCSCRKYSEYTPAREEGLVNYAYSLFYDMVASPAIAMDISYEFQNFLNLDEKQRKDHMFANMVIQYDFNKYALLLYDGLCNLVIETHGCDLQTPGKGWDLYLETRTLFEYLDIVNSYYGYYSDINLFLECKGSGCWDIMSDAREGKCCLTLADDNTLERVWLASTSGSETEEGATGIRSDYSTEDFEIGFKKNAAEGTLSCSFNGKFQVLISSFDEIKERAVILGKPGFAINCITEIKK